MDKNMRFDVTIGEGTQVGQNCAFYHARIGKFSEILSNVSIGRKGDKRITVLGSNLWIGSHVTIAPGVKIGNCVTISPGSSIVRDIPDYAVVSNGIIEDSLRYEQNYIDFLNKNPWWDSSDVKQESLAGYSYFDKSDFDQNLWNRYVRKENSHSWRSWKKIYGGAKKCLKFAPALPFYAGKMTMDREKANGYIAHLLRSGEPFAVSRFGETELRNIIGILDIIENGWEGKRQAKVGRNLHSLTNNTGFFPKDERMVPKFTKTMIEACKEIDVLGVWYLSMEAYIIEKYMTKTELTHLLCLEPYLAENPWSKALEGKKVLVIHPFDSSISGQYQNREKLFKNKDVLPEFELITMKAVQTLAGTKDERFNTWFDALEYMTKQALSIDFDVAIIGCGAYGMPLAANLKRAGKQAIHLGGATQLLFGIKGKRWDKNYPSKIATLFNESWIYPSNTERPAGSSKVENSCYW